MIAKMLFRLREKVFEVLIGRNPERKREYLDFVQHRESQNTLETLKKTLYWIVKYEVFRYTPQKEMGRQHYPESAWNEKWRGMFERMCAQALEADVISFDLFGTMIVSPFTDERGFFMMVGGVLGIANFSELRVRAERQAREDQKGAGASVVLADVYSILEKWCAVPVEEGVLAETRIKKEFCFANPEGAEMYRRLMEAGKKVVFVSATCFSPDVLEEILCKNGIDGYEKVFVSHERNGSDSDCSLQRQVESCFGDKKKFYHISCKKDVAGFAGRNNWGIGYYPSLHMRGTKYRPYDMSADIKSIYDSICKIHLYSGRKIYSIFYEFGFTCGGILAIGLCQWLNEMAKQYGFDQFLFVARDGDIISKVYQTYFNQVESEYLLFSRMASEQLVFEDFTEEYVNHVILPELREAEKTLTVGRLFQRIGMGAAKKYWEREGRGWDTPAGLSDYEQIRAFIYKYKGEISKLFQEATEGAKQYFRKVIGANKKICVFDIGWRGTSLVYLKHLMEKKYQFPVHVTGALLGSGDEDYANSFFMDGSILVFAFSKYKNAKTMEEVCRSQERILAMELLFSSDSSSVLSYGMGADGKAVFHFEKENPQSEMIREIHRGILDYVEWHYRILGTYASRIHIHSQDAVAPVMAVLQNEKHVKKLIEKSKRRANARHGFDTM